LGGACSTNGEEGNVYRLLVGKPEGKRLLGRPRRRWVDDIKMDLEEIGRGGMDWIGLAQDRDKCRARARFRIRHRRPRRKDIRFESVISVSLSNKFSLQKYLCSFINLYTGYIRLMRYFGYSLFN
jgi:hypothetical protein